MAASSSTSLIRPKLTSSSLSSSFSLLNLFSTSISQPQPQVNPNEIPPAESKLLESIHALIKSHHTPTLTFSTSHLPPTHTIPSLSFSLSSLSPSPLPSSLPLIILRRFSNLRHGVPFPQILSFFNWWLSSLPSEAKTNLAHEPFVEMLDLAAKHHYFHVSWHIIDTMKELGMHIPHSAFAALVRRYARASRPDDAVQAFHRMGDYGIEPSASSFSLLIASLAKKRFGKEAQEVFDLLKEKFPSDVVVYSALIHAWCRAGKIEDVERVFIEMKKGGVSPNVYTYTSVIDALCRGGQIPKAQEVLCQMIDAGCKPNAATFKNLIRGHVKAGRMERKAHEVFCQMIDAGCKPNAATFKNSIRRHVIAGRMEQVLQVHNQMKKLLIVPDVITYNFIIDAHCGKAQRNFDAALKVLNSMPANACSPNAHSFNPIFRCILDVGDVCTAHRLYDRMRELECKPNTVTYYLLMELFRKEESTDMMMRMKKEMDDGVVEASVNTYRLLIKAFCERGHWKMADQLLREMEEEKCLKPTFRVYKMVIAVLRGAGQWKRVGELVEKVAERGFIPS